MWWLLLCLIRPPARGVGCGIVRVGLRAYIQTYMRPSVTSHQVKPDVHKAIEALRAKGVEGKVGIVGFCWGGKISTLASQVRGSFLGGGS